MNLNLREKFSICEKSSPSARMHLNLREISFPGEEPASFEENGWILRTGGESVVLYNSTGQVLATRQPARRLLAAGGRRGDKSAANGWFLRAASRFASA